MRQSWRWCSITCPQVFTLSLPILRILLSTLVIVWASTAFAVAEEKRSSSRHLLSHLTFASCNRQHQDQSFWVDVVAPTIAAEREPYAQQQVNGTMQEPSTAHTDLFLWLGNAAYTDIDNTGVAMRQPREVEEIEQEYRVLTGNPHYRRFVEEVVLQGGGRVAGVFDDRDLGIRWAGPNDTKSTAVRAAYIRQLWRGWSPNVTAAVTRAPHGSLYSFLTIPTPPSSRLATYFVNSQCVITLDIRTQRSPLPNLADALLHAHQSSSPAMMPGVRHSDVVEARARRKAMLEADVLGSEQWAWLSGIIETYIAPPNAVSPEDPYRRHCAVTIIASPLQILLNDNKPFEGWDLYPSSRSRLLALLKQHAVERVVLLSGHAETAEIGVVRRAPKEDLVSDGPTAMLYKSFPLTAPTKMAAQLLPPQQSFLLEATSSGVTHVVGESTLVGRFYNFAVSPRIKEAGKSQSMLKRWIYIKRETAMERNFGTVQIEEAHDPPRDSLQPPSLQEVLDACTITIQIRRAEKLSAPLLSHRFTLSSLPSYKILGTEDGDQDRVTEASSSASDDPFPVFAVFNAPGEYPWLKATLAQRQCPEVPCASGQLFMIVKIVGMLSGAFVLALLFLGATALYQSREPLYHEKVKTD